MGQFLGFGDGSDGALTISANTTDAPIDSACTGTGGTKTLSATNASFAANQFVLIHQSQGTNAGQWEIGQIDTYVAGTITLKNNLDNTYGSGAQVLVIEKNGDINIQSGKTLSAKAWNGTVGGLLVLLSNGTTTVTGNISGDSLGYRGGSYPNQGEGNSGVGGNSSAANGSGGGAHGDHAGGGGGGNSNAGSNGTEGAGNVGGPGIGGSSVGSGSLVTMLFGGGGGAANGTTGIAGNGGAIILIITPVITVTGSITTAGGAGAISTGDSNGAGGSGGGAGGCIFVKTSTGTFGVNLLTALAGSGGSAAAGAGGNGSVGYIRIEACTITDSGTYTTNPSASAPVGGYIYCSAPSAII